MFASSELHKLIASKQWAEAHERIATHKAEAFKILNCDSLTDDIRRKIKAYPLHNACFLQAPGYIITALVEAFPGAVKLPDTGYRRLPIHHAILGKGYPETVAELLEKYPESAMVQDCLGRLPLHYAMFCKMPIHVVELIIRAYPAGVKVQDIKGWTPLHIAGAVAVPLPLVRSAVFACPEVLEKVDIHTFCPRDFFIVHDTVTRDVIDFLVLSTPKQIEMMRDVKSLYKQMMKRGDSAPATGHHQSTHPLDESRNVAGKI
ncbi:hypothetical protein MHU86_22895 [Fragilaria crotonensis]|nr:hypothetical protein MHU86_22895 [Fragilaria crotonensis]